LDTSLTGKSSITFIHRESPSLSEFLFRAYAPIGNLSLCISRWVVFAE